MAHNYEAQRRETFDTFRKAVKGQKLPETAVVDFLFFVEENDASWPAFETGERRLATRGRLARQLAHRELGHLALPRRLHHLLHHLELLEQPVDVGGRDPAPRRNAHAPRTVDDRRIGRRCSTRS